MNSWFDPFTFSISGAALLLCAMGLWFTAILPGLDRWNRRFFLSYFTIFTLICLSGVAELVFQHYIVPRPVFVFLLLLESLLTTLPQLFLTVLLLHYCDENIRSSKLFHTVLGLWAVFFILVASSLFIEGFFYVTAENQYYLGSLYSPSLLPVIAIQLLNLIGTIQRRKRISRKVFLALIIAILPMTVTLFIHMFVDIFPLRSSGNAVGSRKSSGNNWKTPDSKRKLPKSREKLHSSNGKSPISVPTSWCCRCGRISSTIH